jgi:hypothetical protein
MASNIFIVTAPTARQVAELAEFCAERGIQLEQKGATAITVPAVMSEEYLKPSKAMKTFCGSEWANKHGLLQPKAALELVIKTIQRCGLLMTSDMVQLNESLQYALNTQLSSTRLSDLPDLVNACFEAKA